MYLLGRYLSYVAGGLSIGVPQPRRKLNAPVFPSMHDQASADAVDVNNKEL